jgi:hypothetical protein
VLTVATKVWHQYVCLEIFDEHVDFGGGGRRGQAGGYKEMSSILADQYAVVYEPNCGGGGGVCGVSAN